MGLTPCSLYNSMVAADSFSLSLAYFFCSFWSWGCSSCMAFIDRICRCVSGKVRSRTTMVRPMIARTKLLKSTA